LSQCPNAGASDSERSGKDSSASIIGVGRSYGNPRSLKIKKIKGGLKEAFPSQTLCRRQKYPGGRGENIRGNDSTKKIYKGKKKTVKDAAVPQNWATQPMLARKIRRVRG